MQGEAKERRTDPSRSWPPLWPPCQLGRAQRWFLVGGTCPHEAARQATCAAGGPSGHLCHTSPPTAMPCPMDKAARHHITCCEVPIATPTPQPKTERRTLPHPVDRAARHNMWYCSHSSSGQRVDLVHRLGAGRGRCHDGHSTMCALQRSAVFFSCGVVPFGVCEVRVWGPSLGLVTGAVGAQSLCGGQPIRPWPGSLCSGCSAFVPGRPFQPWGDSPCGGETSPPSKMKQISKLFW